MLKKGMLLVLALLVIAALSFAGGQKEAAGEAAPQKVFATIGTGGVTGVYYPAGGAISRIVNRKYDEYKVKVTVESTGGSVFNINAIMAGDLEFGVVQSDRQSQAWLGEAEWKDKVSRKT